MDISTHDLVILVAVGIGVWLLMGELSAPAAPATTTVPVAPSGAFNALDLPTAPLSGQLPSILTQAQVGGGLFGNPSGLQSG